jgi:glycerol-3-phosphate dehydrogenase
VKREPAELARVEHDLLVIGGGIYGVTAAYEAASRGLRVALVEAEDFGAGVSWNSLRTIHGGLRHLQRLDLASHRESVRERRLLLRIAPEIVHPLRFFVPAYGHGRKGRESLRLGLLLDELLALDRNEGLPPGQRLQPGQMLGRDAALLLVPGLDRQGLAGAAVWHDAQVESSERLVIAFLRAAVLRGAAAANHCPVTSLLQGAGRVAGALVRDAATGGEHEIRARFVLNAAGPGADPLLAALGLRAAGAFRTRLLAMNLLFEGPWPLAERFGVGAWSGGRSLFLVPWRDRVLAGTDYRPATDTLGPPAVTTFRDELARAFPWAGIEGRRLCLVHRGLVPGEDGGDGLATRPRIVEHESGNGPAGLVSLQGVKYTTARAVAARAVERVCARLGRPQGGGEAAPAPLEWARPLGGSLGERVKLAVRDEMARTLGDVVLRRLDLGTGGPPAPAELDEVARLLAHELGWDEARVSGEKRELARFYEAAYNGTWNC